MCFQKQVTCLTKLQPVLEGTKVAIFKSLRRTVLVEYLTINSTSKRSLLNKNFPERSLWYFEAETPWLWRTSSLVAPVRISRENVSLRNASARWITGTRGNQAERLWSPRVCPKGAREPLFSPSRSVPFSTGPKYGDTL